jgi:hypothetical protein
VTCQKLNIAFSSLTKSTLLGTSLNGISYLRLLDSLFFLFRAPAPGSDGFAGMAA